MMGRLETDQGQFFYSYRLDELVPADHLVRVLLWFGPKPQLGQLAELAPCPCSLWLYR